MHIDIVVSKHVGPSIVLNCIYFIVVYNVYHGLHIYVDGVYANGMCTNLQNMFLRLRMYN